MSAPRRGTKPKNSIKNKILASEIEPLILKKVEETASTMRRAITIMKDTAATNFVSVFASCHGSIICEDGYDTVDVPEGLKIWYIPTIPNIGTVNLTIEDSVKNNYKCFMEFVNQIDENTTEERAASLFLKMRYSFIISVFTDILRTTMNDLIDKIRRIQTGNPLAKTLEAFRDAIGWLFQVFNNPNTFRMYVYNGSRPLLDGTKTDANRIINKDYTSEVLIKSEKVNWKILMNLSNNVVPTSLSRIMNAQKNYNDLLKKYARFEVSYSDNRSIDILPIIAAENRGEEPRYSSLKNPGLNKISMLDILEYVKQFSNFLIFHDISCFTAMGEKGLEITKSDNLRNLNTDYRRAFSQFQVFTAGADTVYSNGATGYSDGATAAGATDATATAAGATDAANTLVTIIETSIIQPNILAVIEPKVLAKYQILMANVRTALTNRTLLPFMGGSNVKPKKTKSKKFQRRSKRRNNRKTYKKKARKTKRRRY